MNDICLLLRLLMVHSLVSLIHSDPKQQPLIFQPETLEIYYNWKSTPANSGPLAVACPAKQEEEIQFNQERSLDRKSLFVQDYSQLKTDSVQSILCDEYYKMAVALRTDAESKQKFVEFGYELLPLSSLTKHITNSVPNLSVDNSPSTSKDSLDINDSATKEEMINYDLSNNNNEDFVWLSRIVMKYDFSTWNLENLTYFVTRNAGDMWVFCDGSDLGQQFYGEDKLKQYYSNKNQKTIFSQVTLPKNALEEGGTCKLDNYCVTSYNPLWPYQFRSSPSKPISCSELPTIPVWHETAEHFMDYTEKFLVAAAEVTKQRLKVIIGTYKILTFPKKFPKKPQEMYLLKDKMPIPKIIYKIVKYKSHECDTEKELCWFDVVIVIHNQPEVKLEDIICEDKSQEWGWESIQFMSTTERDPEEKWEFIYVCELDQALEKELGYKSDTPIKGDLNLNNFPVYSEAEHKITFQDWSQKFEKKMYNLFENK